MISPESQGGPNIALITIICGWTFVGIALLGVSLSIWSQRMKKIGLGLDGYLTIFALVTNIALVVQTTWAIVDEGQDNHEAEISRTKFALVSLLVNQTLWGLVNTLVRMSAILFIERILGAARIIKWMTRSLLVLSILYGLVVFLEIFLICRPMAVDWNAHIDGTCGDQIESYLVLEILGLLLDCAILVVPIPTIWSLHMSRAQKFKTSVIFSIGVLVFTITGLRLQALRMVNAQDFTYSKGYLGLLSALGASLGIIICCAPAVVTIYHLLRQASHKSASRLVHIDEENAAEVSETPDEPSLSMTEDNAIQNNDTSARWSIDISSERFCAWLKSGSRAVHTDEENLAAASRPPDVTSLPTTKDYAFQTHGRSARWSLDGCVAGVNPPPYGGLQRHRTF